MRWARTALLSLALLASQSARSIAVEAPCHVAHVALVIGNASYADSDAPLREPIGDARELADALQRLGFATTEAENLTQDRMRSAIEAFEQKVTDDTVALVFFSGYGIQSGGHTYLIPVDAAIWNEQDIKTVGFNLDRILADLADRGARLRLVIIDGARHNPYERRFRPTGSLGMAAVNGTPGVLALYSSLPGTTFDEAGGNTSPFVDALITAISKPGAQAEAAFRRARADATRVYRGSQTPWVSSFLDEDVSLEGGDCRAPHPATAEAAPLAPSPSGVAPTPAQSATSPSLPAQGTPPARPAVALKVPARPVSPVAPPLVVTVATPPPPPAQPQASAPPPQPAPEQTASASVPPAAPPAPARPAPEMPKTQPAASVAPPAPPAPAVEPPPTPPPPHVTEQAAVQTPPQPVPAPPQPTPSVPPPAPRQDVAMTPAPPPSVAEDPGANEQITDPARLKEIKDRLFDQGLNPGDPGSPAMVAAIRAYEEEANLPIENQPTARMLSSLRGRPLPGPWASMALSKKLKHFGMAWNIKSRRTAIAEAQGRCGSDDCAIVESFFGPHCGAVAISDDVGWSMMWRDDEEQARAAALDRCAKSGPQCRIIGAVCADGSGRYSATLTREGQR